MKLAAKTWIAFIVWLNVYCGIMLLNMNETSKFIYAIAALNFCGAAVLCYGALVSKEE